MIDSPLNTLYHAVQKVYAPLMLEDGKWSRSLDPKLQSLISELEAGLGAAMRKQDPSFRGRGKEDSDNLGSMFWTSFTFEQIISNSLPKIQTPRVYKSYINVLSSTYRI